MKPRSKDTPQFTWKNWWYYNKWFVIGGALLIAAAAQVIISNAAKIKPDYQIAYVGAYPLEAERVSALENALTSYGSDLNGDGRVVFKLNQYPTAENADPEIAMGRAGWEVQLMADLLDCESYFFLLEDAEEFNDNYDILEADILDPASVKPFSDIEELKNTELARRVFEGKKTVKNKEGCDALWQTFLSQFDD